MDNLQPPKPTNLITLPKPRKNLLADTKRGGEEDNHIPEPLEWKHERGADVEHIAWIIGISQSVDAVRRCWDPGDEDRDGE